MRLFCLLSLSKNARVDPYYGIEKMRFHSCGVNLSCGYYRGHTDEEYLVKEEWRNTLEILRSWLSEKDIPKFPIFTASASS